MKINRLMQLIFVSGSVCAAVPAFAGSVRSAAHSQPAPSPGGPAEQHPSVQCGDDSDDDGDGDGDGDDGDDDGDGDDGSETIEL
jgi:hypothetical protein